MSPLKLSCLHNIPSALPTIGSEVFRMTAQIPKIQARPNALVFSHDCMGHVLPQNAIDYKRMTPRQVILSEGKSFPMQMAVLYKLMHGHCLAKPSNTLLRDMRQGMAQNHLETHQSLQACKKIAAEMPLPKVDNRKIKRALYRANASLKKAQQLWQEFPRLKLTQVPLDHYGRPQAIQYPIETEFQTGLIETTQALMAKPYPFKLGTWVSNYQIQKSVEAYEAYQHLTALQSSLLRRPITARLPKDMA